MKQLFLSLLVASSLPLTMLAANEVTVSVATPGTLGELILTKTTDLADVETLHVSGTINADDATLIKQSLTSLRVLDMAALQLTELPSEFMYDHDVLEAVTLPKTLKTIGNYAFAYCDNLTSVVMQEGLEHIAHHAFYNDEKLSTATFPSTVTAIDESAFSLCEGITQLTLPDKLTSLGNSAFYSCSQLKSLQLSASLKVIPNNCFEYAYSLEGLTIPEGVEEIGSYAFHQAFWYSESQSAAKQIKLTMPSTLKEIGSGAFYNNCNIVEVTLNEGLKVLNSECFGLTRLTEVTIPSTVSFARAPFYDCNTLGTITCLPVVPPTNYDYNFIKGSSQSTLPNTKLIVPAISLNQYKLTEGYNHYASYETTTAMPATISIGRDAHITTVAGMPKMDVTMYRDLNDGYYSYNGMGTLTLDGTQAMSVGTLSLVYDKYNEKYNKWDCYSNEDNPYGTKLGHSDDYAKSATTLVVKAPMRADAIVNDIRFNYDEWHFISLPYNVRVADITVQPLDEYGRKVDDNTEVTAYFSICEYDGNARAALKSGETWKRLGPNDIMQAGKGYILQSWALHVIHNYYSDGSDYYTDTQAWLRFPAMNDAAKNNIFATSDATIGVTPHASELAHNANWNLVGNPYPCYVNGTALGYDGIVTIWNQYLYQYEALSMSDDVYVFSPYEAFFVQTAVGQTGITMSKDGRQTSRKIPETLEARAARNSNRTVINLTLKAESAAPGTELASDRTRVVVNPAAKAGYEIGRDASKMESLNENASSLYTLCEGQPMAINERPLADGLVGLGLKVAQPGTYTIALSSEPGTSVELIDQQENTVTPLNGQGYTFESKGGQHSKRFVLRIGGTTTGIETVSSSMAADTPAYNLNGQRIDGSHKGIVVKNGKKYIVK